ncbi:MAG TPA: hypothetical protein VF476_11795 [Chitinophagaceae bacterium]
MLTIEKKTEIAHDLMLIQRERLLFYDQARKLLKNDDGFHQCIHFITNQCIDCILELRPYAELRFADPADFSDIKGEVYHCWSGIKGFSTGCQPGDVICVCEENERAATAAYEKALVEGFTIGKSLQQLFSVQLNRMHESLSLLQSHKKPSAPETISNAKKFSVTWSSRLEVA